MTSYLGILPVSALCTSRKSAGAFGSPLSRFRELLVSVSNSVKHCEFPLTLARILCGLASVDGLLESPEDFPNPCLVIHGLLSLELATFKEMSYHSPLVVVIITYTYVDLI